VVSTSSTDRGGYVGRLVAFVDMKVDELWKNDNTLLEINTGSGKPNAFVVYNRKKSFNDGTREKGDQVTVVQQSATSDIESEMLGGLDAGQSVSIPGTSIVVKVCGLGSEATFDFAKVSVYDTSLGQSSNCNVALNSPSPQVTLPVQATLQPAQQVVKPTTQTIVTQNSQQAQLQNRPQQQLPQQEEEEEVCYLRDIGQACRRDSHCCSGKCEGSGWSQKCVA
jgi:hypothetical protein